MRRNVIIALVAYFILAIAIVSVMYWQTIAQDKTFDEFSKGASVGVTLLTAVFAGVISLIAAHSQQRAAETLEQKKGEIAQEVNRANAEFNSQFNERIEKLKSEFAFEVGEKLEIVRNGFAAQMELLKSSLAKEVARETEILKSNLSTNLEFLKARFGLERESFRNLYEAVSHYYHALAPLERGEFDLAAVDEAEKLMVDAVSYTSQLLDDRPKDVWYKAWQIARSIKEKAQSQADETAYKNLWVERGPQLGLLISEFEEIASMAYRGALLNLSVPPVVTKPE